MPIQFLPQQQNPMWSGIGDLLGLLGGGAIGYGLGQHKQSQTVQALKTFFSDQEANVIAKFPPAIQAQIIKDKMKEREARRQSEVASNIINPQSTYGMPPGTNMEQVLGNLGGQQSNQQQAPQMMPKPTMQQPMQSTQPGYEQRIQAALSGGLNPQNLNLVSKVLGDQEKIALQKESLQAKREAPHRTQVAKQVAEYQRKGELADKLIADYDAMTIMADNPELRTGVIQQLLTMAKIPTAFQSDVSFVADKLIGDITIASAMKTTTPGKLTARLLEEYAKVNPSRLSSPQGIKDTLKLKKMSELVEKTISDKINEILEDSPNGIPPINIIQRAQKEAKPEIEAIHKEQEEFARSLIKKSKNEKRYTDNKDKVPKGVKILVNGETGERGYIDRNGKLVII